MQRYFFFCSTRKVFTVRKSRKCSSCFVVYCLKESGFVRLWSQYTWANSIGFMTFSRYVTSKLTPMHAYSAFQPLHHQPSPHRRDERPVSCYAPSSNSHLQSNLGSGGRDAANLSKEKPRAYVPNLVNNETYGTILNTSSPQSSTTTAPPLPPRNLGKLGDWLAIFVATSHLNPPCET